MLIDSTIMIVLKKEVDTIKNCAKILPQMSRDTRIEMEKSLI